jgi:hypothetical protein
MTSISSLVSLLVLTCGVEFLVSLLVVEVVLLGVAFYLAFGLRAQFALNAFLPLTFAPLFIGSLCSLMTLSISVDLMQSVDAPSTEQADGAMLLGMSAAPVLFSAFLVAPAFLVVVWGRIWLTLQANRKPKAAADVPAQNVLRGTEYDAVEADEYIAQLTKRRR